MSVGSNARGAEAMFTVALPVMCSARRTQQRLLDGQELCPCEGWCDGTSHTCGHELSSYNPWYGGLIPVSCSADDCLVRSVLAVEVHSLEVRA